MDDEPDITLLVAEEVARLRMRPAVFLMWDRVGREANRLVNILLLFAFVALMFAGAIWFGWLLNGLADKPLATLSLKDLALAFVYAVSSLALVAWGFSITLADRPKELTAQEALQQKARANVLQRIRSIGEGPGGGNS